MDDATRAQVIAADPGLSTWLGANAGSGKTRVLTDRVARLLLDGVSPERILCLTYTKAAAMEMQNRLFARLGAWAMRDDGGLSTDLAAIGVESATITPALLDRARTLFARAIETPGGLKIQTIHSFCASVLRRFPLEAGISPGFTEIDTRIQTRLLQELLDQIAGTAEGRRALLAVAGHIGGDDGLLKLAQGIVGKRTDFMPPATWPEICAACDIPDTLSEADIVAQVFSAGDRAHLAGVLPLLLAAKGTSLTLGHKMQDVNWDNPEIDDVLKVEGFALLGKTAKKPFGPKINALATKDVRAAMDPGDLEWLNGLCQRAFDARALRLGLVTAERTMALHDLARLLMPAYDAAKAARGWLDFDDLIDRTRALLEDPKVAAWVLYRLDGGIDHMLVDEAQDTAPRQWAIIQSLTEEFAAGHGARSNTRRTIFVVGDVKQSIYSFQGADPAEFDRMRAQFQERMEGVGDPLQTPRLIHSFRSSGVILSLVDRIAAGRGAVGLTPETDDAAETVTHKAYFTDKPGRIDLWPPIEASTKSDPTPWDAPQDLISDEHHVAQLARALADQVAAMLQTPPLIQIGDQMRPVTAGDILILVRRRSPLFHRTIAALKKRGLPVAGVDRASLTTPLAVKDLLALCRFLATPEDDLSLAAILRGPLIGLSETDLFDIAHGRRGHLWPALRKRAAHYPRAYGILSDLLDQADFLSPYEILERVLVQHGGRARMIARLGGEAEDAIDTMLSQAMLYETTEPPSLTGFVGWLESGDVEVTRDLSKPAGEIRVMTVHGAKGLEAPVVILPDCAHRPPTAPSPNLQAPEGGPLCWLPKTDDRTETFQALDAARIARAQAEDNRLLYVALTRAESWLIVAAAGKLENGKGSEVGWYRIVEEALRATPGVHEITVDGFDGPGLRVESVPGFQTATAPDAIPEPHPDIPDWAKTPAPSTTREPRLRSPSDLGGAKALVGVGDETKAALRRGRLTHLLLEHLPPLPPAAWPGAAPGIASLESANVSDAELAPILSEVRAVLTTPELAHLFQPDALAEVPISGHSETLNSGMFGIIDRLTVSDTEVWAVDFKTNATVPPTPEAVPEGLLRQMGAYAEMLAPIYPEHQIHTAILWTRTASLMALPHDIVSQALKRARDA